MSKTKQVNGRFRDLLKTEFKIKELGKSKHILSVRVEFVKNGISLSQRQYIEEIVCNEDRIFHHQILVSGNVFLPPNDF